MYNLHINRQNTIDSTTKYIKYAYVQKYTENYKNTSKLCEAVCFFVHAF